MIYASWGRGEVWWGMSKIARGPDDMPIQLIQVGNLRPTLII